MTTLQKVSLLKSEKKTIPTHVTGLVHELKNPISICNGYCEFLYKEEESPLLKIFRPQHLFY